DGACDSQNAVVGTGAQAETFDRAADQRGAGAVQFAEGAHVRDAHFCVACDASFGAAVCRPIVAFAEATPLALTRSGDSGTDRRRPFAEIRIGQFLEVHPGNSEMHVDAVQDRPAETLLVAGDRGFSTRARSGCVAVVAARTRIARRDEHELGRKAERL